jgi:hypothetical protein
MQKKPMGSAELRSFRAHKANFIYAQGNTRVSSKDFFLVTKDPGLEKKVRNSSAGLRNAVDVHVFSSSLESLASCSAIAPAAMIMDVTSHAAEESLIFFQKFRGIKTCNFIPLVAICKKITASFMNLSSEYNFFRIIEKESEEKNILFEDVASAGQRSDWRS